MALNVFFDLDALKSLSTLSWDESNECVTNKSILYYAYWIMNFAAKLLCLVIEMVRYPPFDLQSRWVNSGGETDDIQRNESPSNCFVYVGR